jgi:hypothetical protein
MNFYQWLENTGKLPFYSSCVGSWGCNQDTLDYLNQAEETIEYEEFKQLADVEPNHEGMFWNIYDELDYAVSFHKIPNWPIAYFRHSGIEYVYAEPKTIELFQHAIERDDLYDHGNKWFDTDKYPYSAIKKS